MLNQNYPLLPEEPPGEKAVITRKLSLNKYEASRERSAMCGKCNLCLKDGNNMVIAGECAEELKEGETVLVLIENFSLMKNIFLVYGGGLAVLISALLGGYIFTENEFYIAGFTLVSLAVYFLILKVYFKKNKIIIRFKKWCQGSSFGTFDS